MPEGLIRHRVFDSLRKDILSCVLQPGEEIRENELAAHYGVSKSPIRDALQRLEFEGLVEIIPRRGHKVTPISISDAEDMLNMREILEGGAMRNIVANASDKTLASLNRFRNADVNNPVEFAQYNRHFHLHLCEISGNKRLADSMRRLMESYDRLCVVSLTSARDEVGGMEEALKYHNMIIDALQARNATGAARASAKHIQKSHTQIMRGLNARPIVA